MRRCRPGHGSRPRLGPGIKQQEQPCRTTGHAHGAQTIGVVWLRAKSGLAKKRSTIAGRVRNWTRRLMTMRRCRPGHGSRPRLGPWIKQQEQPCCITGHAHGAQTIGVVWLRAKKRSGKKTVCDRWACQRCGVCAIIHHIVLLLLSFFLCRSASPSIHGVV